MQVRAYAAQSADTPLAPFAIERRDFGPHDVQIDILYCGVCHSDLHQARNDWSNSEFPMVPGHEIVGRVTDVGAHVTKLKVGDLAGVGCLVDSCRDLRRLQRRPRAVLPRRRHPDLQRPRARHRRADLRRLFREDHRRGALRRLHPREPRPEGRRAAALRRHHHLLAAPPLEGRPRPEGRRRRPRRPRPHGRQVRQGARRPRRDDHHLAGKGQGRPPPRRRRGAGLTRRRTRWPTPGSFDFLLNTIPVGHDMNPYLDAAEARRHHGASSAR